MSSNNSLVVYQPPNEERVWTVEVPRWALAIVLDKRCPSDLRKRATTALKESLKASRIPPPPRTLGGLTDIGIDESIGYDEITRAIIRVFKSSFTRPEKVVAGMPREQVLDECVRAAVRYFQYDLESTLVHGPTPAMVYWVRLFFNQSRLGYTPGL